VRAGPLPRRARLAACGTLLPVLALLASACGSGGAPSNAAVTVDGTTLSIYASQPPGDAGGSVAADVLDAEKLAFAQSGARVAGFHLRFGVVHAREVSADARDVVSDKTAIAYLGEIPPGTSGVSVQITNELGLLQVSPTDTAAYLTRSVPSVPNSPLHFFPAHGNFQETFGRVVPSSVAEAKALVARMKSDGVGELSIADDGTDYGASVAAEVRADASAAGIGSGGGGAMFYAGLPGPAATRALDAAAARDPRVKLYAPSALYDESFVGGLSGAAQRAITISVPGIPTASLNAVGRAFTTRFRSQYGHAPAPPAIFGYETMRAVIAALQRAGSHAAVRQTVVDDFRDLTRPADGSAVGAYTIKGGDSNLTSFVFAGVSGGRLVPRTGG
jgi:ABC-type branched-subunit amino acid transport system substrate-binding protein